jgi:hypothetical protein
MTLLQFNYRCVAIGRDNLHRKDKGQYDREAAHDRGDGAARCWNRQVTIGAINDMYPTINHCKAVLPSRLPLQASNLFERFPDPKQQKPEVIQAIYPIEVIRRVE